jgi:hypothetical protein
VDGAHGLIDGEQDEHPLDLAPVTEMDVVTALAALVRAHRRLDSSMIAKSLDQRCGIVVAATIDENREMHVLPLYVARPPAGFQSDDPSGVPVSAIGGFAAARW